MTVVHVFDPPMCCSTGICGPTVDPKLVRFSADLDWFRSQGATVERFNLSQQPAAFAADSDARHALETKGEMGLPLIKVNGEVKSSGSYPSREQLAAWIQLDGPQPSIYSGAVAELVAIGAAIASNCETCFKFHYDKARKLGVSREDMLRAVTTAQNVKDAPAKNMLDLAQRYLSRDTEEPKAPNHLQDIQDVVQVKSRLGGCCGPSTPSPGKKSGCC